MVHVNKPIEGDATYWQQIIGTANYDTFFQPSNIDETNDGGTQIHGTKPTPKNHLHFVYVCTVCCGDRKKLVPWLSDKELQANSECYVFKKIRPSDEAWAAANVVNQYDGWCKKFETSSGMSHPIHKKSLGKWTSLN